MFAPRIREIPGKLERVRKIPGSEAWFGAATHGFRLRPTLPEGDVREFEKRHGIVLPEDYRQFLLHAGDGGAGPFYGIDPLSRWDQWFEEEGELPGFLASPCPMSEEPSRSGWMAARERDERLRRGEARQGARPTDAWGSFYPGGGADLGKGSINICDQGCTYSARLIVSGPLRGRVVYYDAQLWYPPYFVRDASFLDWYERWLEGALQGTDAAGFGFDNPRC